MKLPDHNDSGPVSPPTSRPWGGGSGTARPRVTSASCALPAPPSTFLRSTPLACDRHPAAALRRPRTEARRPETATSIDSHAHNHRSMRCIGHAIKIRPHPEEHAEGVRLKGRTTARSEEHTSELQSLMRNSYSVFC